MKELKNIMLPGLNEQLNFVLRHISSERKDSLVLGANLEAAALRISAYMNAPAELIVNDSSSLLNSKFLLAGNSEVRVRMMDYTVTDFQDNQFDFIYAQASVSTTDRNKIIKEIKRILKPGGIFCVGEIVNLGGNAPVFIEDIWKNSDLKPLGINELPDYYTERNFRIVEQKNFSHTLRKYYAETLGLLKEKREGLSSQEQSYYKKLLNRISHETKAYLNQGGDKYIGFLCIILEKV